MKSSYLPLFHPSMLEEVCGSRKLSIERIDLALHFTEGNGLSLIWDDRPCSQGSCRDCYVLL